MKIFLTESKVRDSIFNYLDDSPLFKDVSEHRTGYPVDAKEYFQEVSWGEDIDPDYDHVFTYYRDHQSYEDITGVEDYYPPHVFPLIELDTNYVYTPLSNLFTDEMVKKYVREWLNQKFGLDAVHLEPN